MQTGKNRNKVTLVPFDRSQIPFILFHLFIENPMFTFTNQKFKFFLSLCETRLPSIISRFRQMSNGKSWARLTSCIMCLSQTLTYPGMNSAASFLVFWQMIVPFFFSSPHAAFFSESAEVHALYRKKNLCFRRSNANVILRFSGLIHLLAGCSEANLQTGSQKNRAQKRRDLFSKSHERK